MLEIMKIFLLIVVVFGAHPRITHIDRIQYLSEFFERNLPAERAVHAQPLSPADEQVVCALVGEFIEANEQTELVKFIPILHAAKRLELARTDFKKIEYTVLRHIMAGKKRVSSTVHGDAGLLGLIEVPATTTEPIHLTAVPKTTQQKMLKSILVVRERSDVTGSILRTPSVEEVALVEQIASYFLLFPNWNSMVEQTNEIDGFAHAHYIMAVNLNIGGLSNQLRILRDLEAPGASIAYMFFHAYSVLINRSGDRMPERSLSPPRPQSRPMMDVLDNVFSDPRYQREPMICSRICTYLENKAREGDLVTIEKILRLATAAGTQPNEMANAFFPAYKILKNKN